MIVDCSPSRGEHRGFLEAITQVKDKLDGDRSRFRECHADALKNRAEIPRLLSCLEARPGLRCTGIYPGHRHSSSHPSGLRLRRPLAKAIDGKLRNDKAEAHRYNDSAGGQAVGDCRAQKLQRRMRVVGKL